MKLVIIICFTILFPLSLKDLSITENIDLVGKNNFQVELSNSQFFHDHYSQCTFQSCGYEFQEADWTYLGKDSTGNWQHVCETHRDNFQWAVLQIFGHLPKDEYRVEPYKVPCYTNPPQLNTDLWIWRYLNFEKFKSFIETKAIFFPKASKFNDPLECAVSIKENEKWLKSLRMLAYQQFNQATLGDLLEDEKITRIENRIIDEIEANKQFREQVLVSCWHANDYESEAMWQIYRGENHQAVAISINMCNLRNALPKPIHMGEVSYVDYEKIYPTRVRVFKKHISYQHEKEVRIVIFPEHINCDAIKKITVENSDAGLLIKPDERLLQIRVYVSPWCDERFREQVRELITDSNWAIGNGNNPSIIRVIETKYHPIY